MCLALAIFSISETPEDAELFNTAAPFGGDIDPEKTNSPIIPTNYAPPPTNEAAADPELGEGNKNSSTESATPETPAVSAPVDLLDSVPSKEQTDMADLD